MFNRDKFLYCFSGNVFSFLKDCFAGYRIFACVLSHIWVFVTPWTIAPRLLRPWDSPGKNTGVGYYFLLQGIFLTQGLSPQSPTAPTLAGGFFTMEPSGRPIEFLIDRIFKIFFQCFESLIPLSLASWFFMRNWLLILLIITCTWWVASLTAFIIFPLSLILNRTVRNSRFG